MFASASVGISSRQGSAWTAGTWPSRKPQIRTSVSFSYGLCIARSKVPICLARRSSSRCQFAGIHDDERGGIYGHRGSTPSFRYFPAEPKRKAVLHHLELNFEHRAAMRAFDFVAKRAFAFELFAALAAGECFHRANKRSIRSVRASTAAVFRAIALSKALSTDGVDAAGSGSSLISA